MIWDKILPISPEGLQGERAGAGDRGGDTAESEHGGGGGGSGGGGSGGGQLYSSPILVSYYLFLTDNTYITVCY